MLKQYTRVLPRDAFNEGNLLKCLGRLFLLCEDAPKNCKLVHVCTDGPFYIMQNDADGAITCDNIFLGVGNDHTLVNFWRPLNSREPWPLYVVYKDEIINVFNDDPEGNLSDEFKELIGYGIQ